MLPEKDSPIYCLREKAWFLTFWDSQLQYQAMPCAVPGDNLPVSSQGKGVVLGGRTQVSSCFINRLLTNSPLSGPIFTPIQVSSTPIPESLLPHK